MKYFEMPIARNKHALSEKRILNKTIRILEMQNTIYNILKKVTNYNLMELTSQRQSSNLETIYFWYISN